jgi:hypothetical protein
MSPRGGGLGVISVERFDRHQLLSSLRETRLRGFDHARPYDGAKLELAEATDPDGLAPAQRYVLKDGVRTILELREALLPHGIDVFSLDGGAYVRTEESPGESIPVLPPIVEESHEPDGRIVSIVNDGIHRVFAARSLGLSINTVTITGMPPEYPYYALALPNGWSEVSELAELPDGFQKKTYRNPDSHKALYREFNEVFPGVQKERKKSNPGFLQA